MKATFTHVVVVNRKNGPEQLNFAFCVLQKSPSSHHAYRNSFTSNLNSNR